MGIGALVQRMIVKQGADKPEWPFYLVLLSPVVTVPLTGLAVFLTPTGCVIGDESSFSLLHLQLAFLPGAVNLLPFLW